MGQAIAADATILGAGVNLELLGRDFDEGPLLGLAYAYEQATKWRTTPSLFPSLVPGAPGVPPSADPPTYTVTASAPTVEMGDTVDVTVAVSDPTDLYAYDLTLRFEPRSFAYVKHSVVAGTNGTTVDDKGRGTIRMVHTRLGTSPAASGNLATVTLRAVGRGKTSVDARSIVSVGPGLETTTTPDLGSAEVTVVRRAD
jgi:hypothetical protein